MWVWRNLWRGLQMMAYEEIHSMPGALFMLWGEKWGIPYIAVGPLPQSTSPDERSLLPTQGSPAWRNSWQHPGICVEGGFPQAGSPVWLDKGKRARRPKFWSWGLICFVFLSKSLPHLLASVSSRGSGGGVNELSSGQVGQSPFNGCDKSSQPAEGARPWVADSWLPANYPAEGAKSPRETDKWQLRRWGTWGTDLEGQVPKRKSSM